MDPTAYRKELDSWWAVMLQDFWIDLTTYLTKHAAFTTYLEETE